MAHHGIPWPVPREARRELPDEAFVPTRIVLDDPAFDAVMRQVESPPPPTAQLVELMRG